MAPRSDTEVVLFAYFKNNFICPYLYLIISVPVVLYGCETWSLTLREEHRLRVFENRVLRMILKGRKTDRGENCIMTNFVAYILH
jgi:hypothetical protein